VVPKLVVLESKFFLLFLGSHRKPEFLVFFCSPVAAFWIVSHMRHFAAKKETINFAEISQIDQTIWPICMGG
jgi:hypothetical protein